MQGIPLGLTPRLLPPAPAPIIWAMPEKKVFPVECFFQGMSLSLLNMEELDQARKQKLHKMLQYLVSVSALGFGWFLLTQRLSFAPKIFSAEGLGVHRLRTLLSQLALLCRCPEKTFHHILL